MSSDDLRPASSSSESSQPESTPPVPMPPTSSSFSSATPVAAVQRETESCSTQDSECCRSTYFSRHPVQFALVLLAVVAALVFFGFRVAHGDTVYLKDGRSIYAENVVWQPVVVSQNQDGEPVHDPRSINVPKGKVRLLFSNNGWMDISTKRVLTIMKDDKDAFKNHNFILKD